MEDLVQVISTDVDIERLKSEVLELWQFLECPPQISLTTETGNPDDWTSGNGYNGAPEKFCVINANLTSSYIADLIQQYPEYARWRIMASFPKSTLTVHRDGFNGSNHRIHIPVQSNPNAWLAFYQGPLTAGSQVVSHYHLEVGKVYLCNTTDYHTAVNYDHTEVRIHIIGERNERQHRSVSRKEN